MSVIIYVSCGYHSCWRLRCSVVAGTRSGASASASASSSAARWALELGATARNPGLALSLGPGLRAARCGGRAAEDT